MIEWVFFLFIGVAVPVMLLAFLAWRDRVLRRDFLPNREHYRQRYDEDGVYAKDFDQLCGPAWRRIPRWYYERLLQRALADEESWRRHIRFQRIAGALMMAFLGFILFMLLGGLIVRLYGGGQAEGGSPRAGVSGALRVGGVAWGLLGGLCRRASSAHHTKPFLVTKTRTCTIIMAVEA